MVSEFKPKKKKFITYIIMLQTSILSFIDSIIDKKVYRRMRKGIRGA